MLVPINQNLSFLFRQTNKFKDCETEKFKTRVSNFLSTKDLVVSLLPVNQDSYEFATKKILANTQYVIQILSQNQPEPISRLFKPLQDKLGEVTNYKTATSYLHYFSHDFFLYNVVIQSVSPTDDDKKPLPQSDSELSLDSIIKRKNNLLTIIDCFFKYVPNNKMMVFKGCGAYYAWSGEYECCKLGKSIFTELLSLDHCADKNAKFLSQFMRPVIQHLIENWNVDLNQPELSINTTFDRHGKVTNTCSMNGESPFMVLTLTYVTHLNQASDHDKAELDCAYCDIAHIFLDHPNFNFNHSPYAKRQKKFDQNWP